MLSSRHPVSAPDAAAVAADVLLMRRLLMLCGALIGVGGCAIAVIRVAFGPGFDRIALLNLLVGLLGPSVQAVARTGRQHLAVLLLLWGGWLLSAVLTVLHGGLHSLNLLNYPVLIVMACWMSGGKQAVRMTAVTLLLCLALVLADPLQLVVPARPEGVVQASVYLLLCMGCVLALSLTARRSYLGRVARERRIRFRLAEREAEMTRLASVIEQSPSALLIVRLDGRIDYANTVARAASGLMQDLRGGNVVDLPGLPVSEDLLDTIRSEVVAGRVWRGELDALLPDGTTRREMVSVAPLRKGRDQAITHQAWLRQDVTAWRAAENMLDHLRCHDRLTGLGNRAELDVQLERLLRQCAERADALAVLAIGVESVSTVRAARGQEAADALVKELAARLRDFIGAPEHLARLDGEEFVVLLAGLPSDEEVAMEQALLWAEQLHAAMLEPVELPGGNAVTVMLRIGVAVSKPDSAPEELLRKARTALEHSRGGMRVRTEFFATTMGKDAEQRFLVETELRHAIRHGQLRLFLQPQVDAGRHLVGAEALVRWIHPQRGMIPPGQFIPIAETSDLIVELGRWVLTEAIALIGREAAAGRALPLSVNLSPRQFSESGFIAWLGGLIRLHHAPAHLLTLEITEGLVIGDVDETIRRMQALRELGVHFSIDDFGTGYSSLAYLKRLPVEELKIDKAFVQEAPSQPEDAVLVETILSVARHLGLKVVAEGVESDAQADFLRERAQGVIFQGFLFGRPRQAEEWISSWRLHGELPALAMPA